MTLSRRLEKFEQENNADKSKPDICKRIYDEIMRDGEPPKPSTHVWDDSLTFSENLYLEIMGQYDP